VAPKAKPPPSRLDIHLPWRRYRNRSLLTEANRPNCRHSIIFVTFQTKWNVAYETIYFAHFYHLYLYIFIIIISLIFVEEWHALCSYRFNKYSEDILSL
jgi:hypothetical protein